jgi:probable rRNA maturation factor
LGCSDCELNLLLVDDEEITHLNRQYFHRNRPTNVISFPMGFDQPDSPHPHILGDVVISVDTAERHASAVGGETADEILFLMIHGILHLVGYDHIGEREEREKMETKETELFAMVTAPGAAPAPLRVRRRKI